MRFLIFDDLKYTYVFSAYRGFIRIIYDNIGVSDYGSGNSRILMAMKIICV